jgi:hypothetical protein
MHCVLTSTTWLLACLRAQLSYLRAYEQCLRAQLSYLRAYEHVACEHNPVTCVPMSTVPTSTTQLLAYTYIYCDVMECVACLIYCSFAKRIIA